MAGMDPSPEQMQMMQGLMADPEIKELLSNPEVVTKLQSCMSNPSAIYQYMSDPDVMKIIMKLQQMQMGGMGGGDSGMGSGFGAPPGRGGITGPGAMAGAHDPNIVDITSSAQFSAQMAGAGKLPVVVDFTASWCGPCKRIAPTFARLAGEYKGRAVFLKVDGDANRDLVSAKGVTGFPTFHFYVNGDLVDSFSGADESRLISNVESYVAQSQIVPNPYKHFPLKDEETVLYKAIKWELITKKVVEVCKEIEEKKIVVPPTALFTDTDHKAMGSLIVLLNDKAHYHDAKISDDQYRVVDKLLSWPATVIGSGLHFIRMTCLHPHAAARYSKLMENKEQDPITRLCAIAKEADKPVGVRLALWAIANFFSRRVSARAIASRYEIVIDTITTLFKKFDDEELRLACLALLINYAIVFRDEPSTYEAAKVHALSCLIEILETEQRNTKVIYRALVVLGTLLYKDAGCCDIARDLEVTRHLETIGKTHAAVADVSAVTHELHLLLKPAAAVAR